LDSTPDPQPDQRFVLFQRTFSGEQFGAFLPNQFTMRWQRATGALLAESYKVFLPAAFTFAHLALAAAASLALVAGLLRRSFFMAGLELDFAPPLILAHRALAAADILARTAADLRRFLGASTVDGAALSPLATIESIWPCSLSMRSLMAMILLSWAVVKSVRLVIMGH
jgi:hypothetical protein